MCEEEPPRSSAAAADASDRSASEWSGGGGEEELTEWERKRERFMKDCYEQAAIFTPAFVGIIAFVKLPHWLKKLINMDKIKPNYKYLRLWERVFPIKLI